MRLGHATALVIVHTCRLTDHTPCVGSNLCLQTYQCMSGTCTGSNPKTCTPSDTCHTSTCDPGSGNCIAGTLGNGAACTMTQTTASACTDAINKGIPWLVAQVTTDGNGNYYWNSYSASAATGLALIVLQTYALQCGYSPFDTTSGVGTTVYCGNSTTPYVNYSSYIIKGLNWVFSQVQGSMASLSCNGCDGYGGALYTNGITLAAVAAGSDPTQKVPNNSGIYPIA